MVPEGCRKYYSRFSGIVFHHFLLESDEEKNYPESSEYETPLSFEESKSKFSSNKI